MSDWYYAIDGQQHGPVSEKELHRLAGTGGIQPTDLLWRDGFVDWSEASTVAGLFAGGAGPVPPPIDKQFAETHIEPDSSNPYRAPSPVLQPGTARTPEALKIPLLISTVSNCVYVALWTASCIGVVLAIPLGFLAWNEYKLYQDVDRIPDYQFGARAKSLSVWQIVVGVVTLNVPSLVCGILLMMKGGEYVRQGMASPR